MSNIKSILLAFSTNKLPRISNIASLRAIPLASVLFDNNDTLATLSSIEAFGVIVKYHTDALDGLAGPKFVIAAWFSLNLIFASLFNVKLDIFSLNTSVILALCPIVKLVWLALKLTKTGGRVSIVRLPNSFVVGFPKVTLNSSLIVALRLSTNIVTLSSKGISSSGV